MLQTNQVYKKIVLGIAFLAAAAVVGWVYSSRFNQNTNPNFQPLKLNSSLQQQLLKLPDHQPADFSLGGQQHRFEVVNTTASRTQGLSGREEIGADGMLFVFPKADFHGIWMKEMKFNLDLIWFDKSGKVISTHQNLLAPDTSKNSFELKTYKPQMPAAMVLEVPAGFIQELQIQNNQVLEYQN